MGWVANATSQPLYVGKETRTYFTGGRLDPTAGLKVCEKFPPTASSL